MNALINLEKRRRFNRIFFDEIAQRAQINRNNPDLMARLYQSFCLVAKENAIYIFRIIRIPRR
jgi:hypothetical protein